MSEDRTHTCTCGAGAPGSPPEGAVPCPVPSENTAHSFVYAIGYVTCRIPSIAVEMEIRQASGGAFAHAPFDPKAVAGLVAQPPMRYLAQHLCWMLENGSDHRYVLAPGRQDDLDALVASVLDSAPRGVVGTIGPFAPTEVCGGSDIRIVVLDHLFDASLPFAPPRKEPELAAISRYARLTANPGSDNSDRALNFLLGRYGALRESVLFHARADRRLVAIDATSRSVGGRTVVAVTFGFGSDAKDEPISVWSASVDVTEMFPFLTAELARLDGPIIIRDGRR